jgi:segregation and condensation protein A
LSGGEKASLEGDSKPFYLKPPWQVLFDLARLQKVRPWDLNVAFLLSTFLQEMRKTGYVDFTASGTALLSSSVILRMQSQRIFEAELEEKQEEKQRIFDIVPPPLHLPLRFELTITGLEDLLEKLKEALTAECMGETVKKVIEAPPREVIEEYDKMFLRWEEQVNEFYEELLSRMPAGKASFSNLVEGFNWRKIVETFLMLIFLASKGLVDLLQEEEEGELIVVLKPRIMEGSSYLEP